MHPGREGSVAGRRADLHVSVVHFSKVSALHPTFLSCSLNNSRKMLKMLKKKQLSDFFICILFMAMIFDKVSGSHIRG